MINSSEFFRSTLLSPILEVFVKLELYTNSGILIEEITEQVNSDSIGDISVDTNRDIRRMFTLTLDNRNGKFRIGNKTIIW